jgi:hypothetical protein
MQSQPDFQPQESNVVPLTVVPSHPITPPNSTAPAVRPAPDRTEPAQPAAPYTAVFLAKECGISDVTLRTRWFKQVCQAVPKSQLKEGRGFTDLARELFQDYAQTVATGQISVDAWIDLQKQKYAHEWAQDEVEVVNAELVPEIATTSLALLKTTNLSLSEQMKVQLAQVQQFSQSLEVMETEFSEQELEAIRMRGAMRGMQRFQIEEQSALEVYHGLRNQKTN